MKHDPAQIKKLNALMRRLKARHKNLEAPGYDATTQLIIAFLQADASRRKAEQAYDALMEEMVDNNELRVSHTDEIVAVIGQKYPRAHWRIEHMRESLKDVFGREHNIKMQGVTSQPKKEQRHYLDTLTGITPYAAASVMLLSFGGHAIPVDDKLVTLLAKEGAIGEGLTPAQVESMLLRQFKAGDPSVEAHLLLQAWSDGCRTPASVLEMAEPSVVKVHAFREELIKKPSAEAKPKTTKKAPEKTTKKTAKAPAKRTKKK